MKRDRLCRFFLTLMPFAVLLAAAQSGFSQTVSEITEPTSKEIFFLRYLYAKQEPPYSDMAKEDPRYRTINEFNHDVVLGNIRSDLRANAEKVKNVKSLWVRVLDAFGEYDSKYGEYDFGLQDGTTKEYDAFGRTVFLEITNGTLAQTWKLGPLEAERVLKSTGGNRHVILALHLAIEDAPTFPGTGKLLLRAKVLDYEVYGPRNVLLGSVKVN